MEMSEVYTRLSDELAELSLELELQSITEDQLQLLVIRNSFTRTHLNIERFRHRPMEVQVEVDYQRAKTSSDLIRINQNDSSNSDMSNSIRSVLIIGGFFVALFFGAGSVLSSIIPEQPNSTQVISLAIISVVLFLIIGIYVLPTLFKKRDRHLHDFDQHILQRVGLILQEFHKELNDSAILRCWSCFKPIEPSDRICPFCGEQQKD